MPRPHLRIYVGPEADENASAPRSERPDTVSIPLGDVFPLLADAVQNRRAWLTDFEDEEITIPSDLYEVILAYQHYRRPSA